MMSSKILGDTIRFKKSHLDKTLTQRGQREQGSMAMSAIGSANCNHAGWNKRIPCTDLRAHSPTGPPTQDTINNRRPQQKISLTNLKVIPTITSTAIASKNEKHCLTNNHDVQRVWLLTNCDYYDLGMRTC
jgi:hypothetical protein